MMTITRHNFRTGGDVTLPAIGILHWGEREQVGRYVMSAWYHHTYYRTAISGEVDVGRIRQALHDRMKPGHANARLGKFGGWSSIGDVQDLGDGTVVVELLYHIGD